MSINYDEIYAVQNVGTGPITPTWNELSQLSLYKEQKYSLRAAAMTLARITGWSEPFLFRTPKEGISCSSKTPSKNALTQSVMCLTPAMLSRQLLRM